MQAVARHPKYQFSAALDGTRSERLPVRTIPVRLPRIPPDWATNAAASLASQVAPRKIADAVAAQILKDIPDQVLSFHVPSCRFLGRRTVIDIG
jgi:hypothetical protein